MTTRTLDTSRTSPATKQLVDALKGKIVGQESATAALINIIENYKAGFADPRMPAGSALFLGPTGTGKTRVVEALCEILFGDARACIKVDCAEFQHSHEIAKLIGSPPGYLGHRETHPVITQEALDQWHTPTLKLSVLLLDEIEKASDALWSLLLGILDKATLTLGDNRKVDLSKVIVVMTSNLGAKQMEEKVTGGMGFIPPSIDELIDASAMDKIAKDAAKRKFTPEFINRIQTMNVFHTLTRPQIEEVLNLEIAALQHRLNNSFFIHVLPTAKKRILAEGYDPVYGARYLKRALERLVQIPLAGLVTSGQLMERDVVIINDTGKEKFEFSVEEQNLRLT